jgi:hypothetical protein
MQVNHRGFDAGVSGCTAFGNYPEWLKVPCIGSGEPVLATALEDVRCHRWVSFPFTKG